MLILGGGCAALVEGAELAVWANDRRRPGCTETPSRAWPTTNCPRSTWTTPISATTCSASARTSTAIAADPPIRGGGAAQMDNEANLFR